MSCCDWFGGPTNPDDGGWTDTQCDTKKPAAVPAVTSLAALAGGGHFLAARREGGPREGGAREGGAREGGAREGGARGGGGVVRLRRLLGDDAEDGTTTEVVREFKGHTAGVTNLAVLDEKGRFLSAGMVSERPTTAPPVRGVGGRARTSRRASCASLLAAVEPVGGECGLFSPEILPALVTLTTPSRIKQ